MGVNENTIMKQIYLPDKISRQPLTVLLVQSFRYFSKATGISKIKIYTTRSVQQPSIKLKFSYIILFHYNLNSIYK